MGIDGLTYYIKNKLNLTAEKLESGKKIHIDASGWAFEMIGERFYGGDYEKMHQLICKEISQFKECGLIPIAYFDGSKKRMKMNCLKKRQSQRLNYYEHLKEYCNGAMINNDKLPCPPLIYEQLRASLQYMEVEVIDCEEEADAYIASQSLIDEGYCYALDSDFFLFKGIKYIEFGTIKFSEVGEAFSPVWRRSFLAKSIGLTEKELVEISIRMGNDYTKHFQKKIAVEDLIIRFIKKPKGFQYISDNPVENMAYEFSRKLYDLQNLSDYPAEDESNDNSLTDFSQLEFVNKLIEEHEHNAFSGNNRIISGYRKLNSFDYNTIYEKTLDDIKKHKNFTKYDSLDGFDDSFKLNFIDCLYSFKYQLEIRENFNFNKEPRMLYHGITFHNRCNIHRKEILDAIPDSMFQKDNKNKPVNSLKKGERVILPVFGKKDELMEKINNNSFTIIQGETGSGKSTGIMRLLLDESSDFKILSAQPRRIACRNLWEWMSKDYGKVIGLRLGYGEKMGGRNTRGWYVTTGYLARLIRFRPESLHEYSHIIIDEIHERTVDTDILCLFLKKYREKYPFLKIILMSATIEPGIYIKYFKSEPENTVIKIPGNVLDIEIDYIDSKKSIFYKNKTISKISTILNNEWKYNKTTIGTKFTNLQCQLACNLTFVLRKNVLIFVPGISEIQECIDVFEKNRRSIGNNTDFECIAIHSEIPYEKQLKLFNDFGSDCIKVIIATNAAESSITINDIDNIISFGQENRMINNKLCACWTSQTSERQRAGRTGRIRNGNVYRLYPKKAFEQMTEYRSPEILNICLEKTVLEIKSWIGDLPVKRILNELIDPVSEIQVDKSYQILKKMDFITEINEPCKLTNMGIFCSKSNFEPRISRLLYLGKILNCLEEAVIIAVMLSASKDPYRIFSPIVQDIEQYNTVVSSVMKSKFLFDQEEYSVPIMLLNTYISYTKSRKKTQWCKYNSISYKRMKHIEKTINYNLSKLLKNRRGRYNNNVSIDLKLIKIIIVLSFGDIFAEYEKYPSKKLNYELTLEGNIKTSEEIINTLGLTDYKSIKLQNISNTKYIVRFNKEEEYTPEFIVKQIIKSDVQIIWHEYKNGYKVYSSFDNWSEEIIEKNNFDKIIEIAYKNGGCYFEVKKHYVQLTIYSYAKISNETMKNSHWHKISEKNKTKLILTNQVDYSIICANYLGYYKENKLKSVTHFNGINIKNKENGNWFTVRDGIKNKIIIPKNSTTNYANISDSICVPSMKYKLSKLDSIIYQGVTIIKNKEIFYRIRELLFKESNNILSIKLLNSLETGKIEKNLGKELVDYIYIKE